MPKFIVLVFLVVSNEFLLKSQYRLSYSDTLMHLGKTFYKQLDLINAKEKLDSCISLNPKNDECKYYRAKIEYDMGLYPSASVMFKNVLALTERDASSWHMLGLCYTNLKFYDSAEFCFKNAVKLNSRRSEFYANWGKNQFLRGKYSHAEQLYSTAILLDEKNAEYYVNRAHIREKLGLKDLINEDIENAIKLDPSQESNLADINQNNPLKSFWVYGLIIFALILLLLLFLKKRGQELFK